MRRMMFPIASIATNTFREAIRNKVLGSLVFFVVIASVATALLGELSLHEEKRVTANGVLFMSTIFSVVIAVYSTVTLLHNEIERRTIYTLLSKPIARWQFLLGKFFGVGLLLAVVIALLLTLGIGLYLIQGGTAEATIAWAYFTLYLQLLIVMALTLFFASFSSPLLSGMFTVAVFITGNLIRQLEEARMYLRETASIFDPVVDVLLVVLPHFQALNLAPHLAERVPIPAEYLLSSVWYSVSYCSVVLAMAIFIFSRRDFS